MSHSVVTSVSRSTTASETPLWKVSGVNKNTNTHFCYISPHVVLSTGVHNFPNHLSAYGEEFPFVIHSLSMLEKLVKSNSVSKLLVIGAGLSAADAIITAGFHDIPVIHAFRRDVSDPQLIFNKLPENMYPEYHKVHSMMKTGGAGYYQGYKALSKHKLHEIYPDGTVVLNRIDTDDRSNASVVKVSHVCVLIGSKPDLSFFPDDGLNLGIEKGEHIDSKSNPVDVNIFTYESFNYPGVYAVGPLVGDNFVRFLQGGALAITSHIHTQKSHSKPD